MSPAAAPFAYTRSCRCLCLCPGLLFPFLPTPPPLPRQEAWPLCEVMPPDISRAHNFLRSGEGERARRGVPHSPGCDVWSGLAGAQGDSTPRVAVCPSGILWGGGCPQPYWYGDSAELCLLVLFCLKTPCQCVAFCCLSL